MSKYMYLFAVKKVVSDKFYIAKFILLNVYVCKQPAAFIFASFWWKAKRPGSSNNILEYSYTVLLPINLLG